MRRTSSAALTLTAIGIGLIACRDEPSADLLFEAEGLCLEGQFVDAAPQLRTHLTAHPNDAVGHYYLGRCYLSNDLQNFTLARGQFITALVLFNEFGQRSPRGRFVDEYFQLMCLADLGKTYFAEIAIVMSQTNLPLGMRTKAAEDLLAQCERLVKRAQQVDPDSHLTKWLHEQIDASRNIVMQSSHARIKHRGPGKARTGAV